MPFGPLRIKRPEDQSLPFDFPRAPIQPTAIPRAEAPQAPAQPNFLQSLGNTLLSSIGVPQKSPDMTVNVPDINFRRAFVDSSPDMRNFTVGRLNNILSQPSHPLYNSASKQMASIRDVTNAPYQAPESFSKGLAGGVQRVVQPVQEFGGGLLESGLKALTAGTASPDTGEIIVTPQQLKGNPDYYANLNKIATDKAGNTIFTTPNNRPLAPKDEALNAASLYLTLRTPQFMASGGGVAGATAAAAKAGGAYGTLNSFTRQHNVEEPKTLSEQVSSTANQALGGAISGAKFGLVTGAGATALDKASNYIKSAEATTQAGHFQPGADLTVPNSGNKQYTAKLLDKSLQDLREGKISQKQFDAIATDHFTQTNGRMPTKQELAGYNPDASTPLAAKLKEQYTNQPTLPQGFKANKNGDVVNVKTGKVATARDIESAQAGHQLNNQELLALDSKGTKPIYDNYTGPLNKTTKGATVAANEASAPTGKFGNARSLQPDELQAIQGGMKQKVAGNVKANISALEMDKALQQVDSNNNISQGYKAFSDVQAGKYNNTEAGKLLRSAFDDAHQQAIQAGMNPGYIDNYIPQMWKQGDKQVAKILQSNGIKVNPGFAAHRQIPSYEWGIEHGLTPKYDKVSQLYGAYVQQLESAKANIGLIKNMQDAGILTAANKAPAGWEPMNLKGFEGMAAPSHVAKVLKSVIGPIDQPAQVVAQKVAAFNSGWQNIVLSGGVPYTPDNFFVYGQLFKETSTGLGGTVGLLKGDTLGVKRLGVWADFIRSHSDEMTNNQILKNKDLITGLADRGVDLRFQSQINAPSAWHRAIDNATFGRFLPLTELRTARDVVAQATRKGMSNSEAMDLAAETIHNYHGINNVLVGLRSKDVQNMITATTFAPQFRESLLNVYGNTAKAFTPGSGQAATLNRYLAAGLGMTFLGYNLLNQKLNGGKNMWQNEPGKEMSLQIPYGEPDSRGIRKAIFIPFAPSFFTVPRNLVEGATSLAHGDVPQFGRNMSSNLAMPLQLAGQLVSNRDYYGRPIYNTEDTVDVNNKPPDSPAVVAAKMGSYAFKQASIPSIRGLVEYFGEKKPAGQAIATGLELPLRYGKVTPEETQSYFKARDQVLNKASKTTRDDYKAIHSGDTGPTPFYSSAEKATAMIKENGGLTELYRVEKSIAQRENNKYPSDPLYSLPDNKAFVVLKLQQLQGTARGGAESKQLKADNPWLSDFYKRRTAFYDSQNIPEKDRVMPPYEEPSSVVAAKLDQYNTLSPANKTNFLRANPDITDYFAKSFDYTNLVRKMQGVAEFAKRPQPSAQTQAKLDYYNTLPKGTGARSSFLRSNPDVTQFFADLKFYDEAGPFGTGIAAGGGGSNKNLAKIADSVYGANSQYASSKSYSKTYSPKIKPFYYSQGYKTPKKIAKPAVSVPRKIAATPIKIVAKKSKA